MRTRKPPLPGLETRGQGSGGYEMRESIGCVWASGTLLPNVLTIARLYTIRRVETTGNGADEILFAKFNDFYLGGGVHLFGHLRSSLTGQKRDARYSSQPKKTTSLLKLYVKLLDCTNPIPIYERCLFTAQRHRQVCVLWLGVRF